MTDLVGLRRPDVPAGSFFVVGRALVHPPQPVEVDDFVLELTQAVNGFGRIELGGFQSIPAWHVAICDPDDRLWVEEPPVGD